jgi:hypothetical protein
MQPDNSGPQAALDTGADNKDVELSFLPGQRLSACTCAVRGLSRLRLFLFRIFVFSASFLPFPRPSFSLIASHPDPSLTALLSSFFLPSFIYLTFVPGRITPGPQKIRRLLRRAVRTRDRRL